jgi:hypothetical protein
MAGVEMQDSLSLNLLDYWWDNPDTPESRRKLEDVRAASQVSAVE